jgi:hypothetical protein
MLRSAVVATTLVLLSLQTTTWAANPPVVRLSEIQPPSSADWFLVGERQTRCCYCETCRRPVPFLLPEVQYFPCSDGQRCGEGVRACGRAVYGMRHPAPYYIPAIEFEVSIPGRCTRCSRQNSLPGPQIPLPRTLAEPK